MMKFYLVYTLYGYTQATSTYILLSKYALALAKAGITYLTCNKIDAAH